MGYTGIAKGNRIELDESLPFPDGTRLRISVSPEQVPRRGSPAAVLRLAGTLSPDEADAILAASRHCRRIDARLWNG